MYTAVKKAISNGNTFRLIKKNCSTSLPEITSIQDFLDILGALLSKKPNFQDIDALVQNKDTKETFELEHFVKICKNGNVTIKQGITEDHSGILNISLLID